MHGSSEGGRQGLSVRAMACERGPRRLFDALDFDVLPGKALLVVGPNGSGKTTLLRALAGLTETVAGEVCWDGQLAALRGSEWRRRIAYAGHKPGHKEELSVAENLRLWCALDGTELADQSARRSLERVGLASRRELPLKRLSQGQKQRLTLARLALSQRPLWLLDEPAASLDDEGRQMLRALLGEHLQRGRVALIATHDDLRLGEPSSTLRLGSPVPRLHSLAVHDRMPVAR